MTGTRQLYTSWPEGGGGANTGYNKREKRKKKTTEEKIFHLPGGQYTTRTNKWWLGVDAEGLRVNYCNRRDRRLSTAAVTELRSTRSLTITVATHHRSCQRRRHVRTHTRAHVRRSYDRDRGTRTVGSLIRPLLRATITALYRPAIYSRAHSTAVGKPSETYCIAYRIVRPSITAAA